MWNKIFKYNYTTFKIFITNLKEREIIFIKDRRISIVLNDKHNTHTRTHMYTHAHTRMHIDIIWARLLNNLNTYTHTYTHAQIDTKFRKKGI